MMWKCERGEKQYKACKDANADYCSDCPHGVKENIEEDIKMLEKLKNKKIYGYNLPICSNLRGLCIR